MKKSKLQFAVIALLIFSLQFLAFNSTAQYTKLLDFAGASNGSHPYGDLLISGAYMYGTTDSGGVNNMGTVFKIKSDGTGYSKLLDFAGTTNGRCPNGNLISDGTYLYGTTDSGGVNNKGTIFKIKPDGTGYSKLLDFSGTANGSDCRGSLISDGTFLYGMTATGGANDLGVIFKIKPDGTGYSKLHDFPSGNGDGPVGSLISDGTFLYGTTSGDGLGNFGTIFKIKPDGSSFTTLRTYTGAPDGDSPMSLVSVGTFLYGMTWFGGANDMGSIFKIKPDGTGYTDIKDFGTTTGNYPMGDLISAGAFLYGMTWMGGTNDKGTIFKIKPDGTGYEKLLDFNGTNGENPIGSLVSDSTFLYGMTESGGANSVGTIFKYQYCVTGCSTSTVTPTSISKNEGETSINIYPNPTTGVITLQMNTVANAYVKIFNALGECVYQNVSMSSNIQIDLSTQLDGMYNLQLTTDKGIENRKIALSH